MTWANYIQKLDAAGNLNPYHLVNAKRLLKNQFAFEDTYAMEAAPTVVTMTPIEWHESPNGDPEWLYMLKRQEYLLDLLAAYWVTEEDVYQQRMKALIFDWIDANHQDESTWRTIDTGIRLVNWAAPVLSLTREHRLSEDETALLNEVVVQQVNYLRTHFAPKDLISNWGVLEVTGIITYAACLPGVIAEADVAWAEAQLATQLDIQVNAQGVHWEQSPLYLMEVWRSVLTTIAAKQAHGLPVAEAVMHKMKKVQRAISHYLLPDLTLLQQGDTDGIRIDSLYQASAMLLHDPQAVQARMVPRMDFLLLALREKEWAPRVGAAMATKFADPVSGNYVWRSSWDADANYWHVFNGQLGSGHGHAALGHVDLVVKGQPVLVDPGRFTYVDGPRRRQLKAAESHNTVRLNGRSLSQPSASWTYDYVSAQLATQTLTFPDGELVKMVYEDRSDTSAIVTRRWMSLSKLGVWLMVDWVANATSGTWGSTWQIAPALAVQELSPQHYALGTTAELFSTLAMTTHEGQFSARYNEARPHTYLQSQGPLMAASAGATVIAEPGVVQALTPVTPVHAGNGQVASVEEAWGVKLTLEGGRDLLVTRQPESETIDQKLFIFDSTPTYGGFNLFIRHHQAVEAHLYLI